MAVNSYAKLVRNKLKDYAQLIKMRLSFLVVFSSAMAYLWATHRHVDTFTIWMLSVSGFLITGSANTINQILERNSDKLMKRTEGRPLPDNRMSVKEAIVLAAILGISGLLLLFKINVLSGCIGLLAIICYSFIYTPLKKVTRLSVVPGAVAGSLPVVIGWTAATGEISREAVLLFTLQFIWQFPHTWSIAWLLNDEYNKAGIKLMPTNCGKSKLSGLIIFISTFLIIPMGLLMYMYASVSFNTTCLLCIAGSVFTLFAFSLFKQKTDKSAVRLMLNSFFYLPFVLIILVLEKYLS